LLVLKYCETGRIKGIVSAITITDVMYILRKHIEPSVVKEAVQALLTIVSVVGILKSDIAAAFSGEMKDFEDAVQTACAARNKAKYIVTRNTRDFKCSSVPAILPADFLKLLHVAN
jgi:predicted nucleic acid-binding protein